MISYKILHHIPGRIRIEVPLIKSLSMANLTKLSQQLSAIPIPEGIKDIHPNPFTGSIVITYEYGKIDIMAYIKDLTSNAEIKSIIMEKIS